MEDQTIGRTADLPRTVSELLGLVRRTREQLERASSELSDEQLTVTSGGWSVKDHLAHVAAWERRLIGEVRGDEVAAHFGLDNGAFRTSNGDALNAMLLARHREDAVATVREEFRAAGEALLETFGQLSDFDLMKPVRPEDPNVDTLVELIGWDTFWQYPEHAAELAGRAMGHALSDRLG